MIDIVNKILSGELLVLTTINHQLTICTPEKAEEIKCKQVLSILDNGFNTVGD